MGPVVTASRRGRLVARKASPSRPSSEPWSRGLRLPNGSHLSSDREAGSSSGGSWVFLFSTGMLVDMAGVGTRRSRRGGRRSALSKPPFYIYNAIISFRLFPPSVCKVCVCVLIVTNSNNNSRRQRPLAVTPRKGNGNCHCLSSPTRAGTRTQARERARRSHAADPARGDSAETASCPFPRAVSASWSRKHVTPGCTVRAAVRCRYRSCVGSAAATPRGHCRRRCGATRRGCSPELRGPSGVASYDEARRGGNCAAMAAGHTAVRSHRLQYC